VELIPDTEQAGSRRECPTSPASRKVATEDEAIADLREALLEACGFEDAMSRLNPPTALWLLELCEGFFANATGELAHLRRETES